MAATTTSTAASAAAPEQPEQQQQPQDEDQPHYTYAVPPKLRSMVQQQQQPQQQPGGKPSNVNNVNTLKINPKNYNKATMILPKNNNNKNNKASIISRSPHYTRSRLLQQLGFTQQMPPLPLPPPCSSSSLIPNKNTKNTVRGGLGHHRTRSCPQEELMVPLSSNKMAGIMAPFEVKLNDSEEFQLYQQQQQQQPQQQPQKTSTGSPTPPQEESSPSHTIPPPLDTTTTCGSSSSSFSTTSSVSSSSTSSCFRRTNSNPSATTNNHSNHNSLQFQDTVRVIPIPSRYQYSDRIKHCLWSNRYELQEMAERNLQEFETEGYDWQNVVLEDDMYIDATNGERIHPCHILGAEYKVVVAGAGGGGEEEKDNSHSDDDDNNDEANKDDEGEEEDDDDDDDDFSFAPLQKNKVSSFMAPPPGQ